MFSLEGKTGLTDSCKVYLEFTQLERICDTRKQVTHDDPFKLIKTVQDHTHMYMYIWLIRT